MQFIFAAQVLLHCKGMTDAVVRVVSLSPPGHMFEAASPHSRGEGLLCFIPFPNLTYIWEPPLLGQSDTCTRSHIFILSFSQL